MEKFSYKAIDRAGEKVEGEIEALNKNDLKSKLKDKGYILLKCSKTNRHKLNRKIYIKKTITKKEITVFTRQMATMMESELPLLRTLNILQIQNKNDYFKHIITKIKEDISNGLALSQALAKYPKIFDNMYINMVKAGETTGRLDLIFNRLADKIENNEEMKRKIRSATVYPIIVIIIAFLILFFLMAFIIPQFKIMFNDAGIELPKLTKDVIIISNFVSKYWIVILLSFFIIIISAKKIYSTEKGAKIFYVLLLKIPFWGDFNIKVEVSRFSTAMATLLKSDVPIINSFDVVMNLVQNRVIREGLKATQLSIKEGNSISKPLREKCKFPIMVTQMVEIGEESGKVPEMLEKIAEFSENEVKESIDIMISMIEPIAIVLLSLIVGTIVLSMFLPIFEMSSFAG